MMGFDLHYNWPEYCSLMGCDDPKLRPHHHHYLHGHLTVDACQCLERGEPGTSKKK